MITIEATIKKSIRHGNGLFATHFIPKNTAVYIFSPTIDTNIAIDDATDEEVHFGYACKTTPGRLTICGDRSKWWNFPNEEDDANCSESDIILNGEPVVIATRDIDVGEELLISQNSDLSYARKIKYVV